MCDQIICSTDLGESFTLYNIYDDGFIIVILWIPAILFIMFALAVLVLMCDFLIKVRSHELPGSEKSLKDYASIGIRSFFIDPGQFAWPNGLQAAKNMFLDKFHIPALQPNHFKGAPINRMPRMYVDMDRKKLTHPMDVPKYSPNWMSQFADPSNSASIKVAVEKQLPLSFFYAKPNVGHYKDRFANLEVKLPNAAMSSLMEKKVPFLVEKQLSRFPTQLTAEQFMQLQGDRYRMQSEKAVIEKPVYPEKNMPYPVEKPVSYQVERHVPYPVEKLVPYPVPVPVRTPVQIPVPVPMVKFDPIFIPVREPSTESHMALWMRQNITSTTEAKDIIVKESVNLLTTEQFEGQTASTEGQFEITSVSTLLPTNTSPVVVLQTQLLDTSKVDSNFAASDKIAQTTELTSRPTPSSSSSP